MVRNERQVTNSDEPFVHLRVVTAKSPEPQFVALGVNGFRKVKCAATYLGVKRAKTSIGAHTCVVTVATSA